TASTSSPSASNRRGYRSAAGAMMPGRKITGTRAVLGPVTTGHPILSRRSRAWRWSVGVEENKALILRFYEEVWKDGNLDVTSEIFAPDYVRYDLRPSQALAGP